jgi:hypothetical protein
MRRRRLLVPLLASALLASAGSRASHGGSAPAADPAAEALIAAWIGAAGGEGLWDAVRDLRYTVTTVWYDPATGRELRRRPRHVWIRKLSGGFMVRVERTEPDGRYVQVWDGRGAWATRDGMRLGDGAPAVIEIPHVAGDLTYWIGLPWKLRDPGVRLRYLESDAHAPGRVVEVSFDPGTGLSPGDRYWYYFGAAGSSLPTQVHFLKQGDPPAARERTLWGEWRRAGRGVYVGERLYVDTAGRPEKALLFSDVIANAGVPASLFRPAR